MTIRTHVKAGSEDPERLAANHSETFRQHKLMAVAMRREPRTTVRKGDRLELLVIRAGLRAGVRRLQVRK